MIDLNKLSAIIAAYKKDFPARWEVEKYKWIAVKHFQERWDLGAQDFRAMFMQATKETHGLLENRNLYPRAMINEYARTYPERIRSMFDSLYDETVALEVRVRLFQTDAEMMRIEDKRDTWIQHYQLANGVSTYLWLRYPDKYYIYRYNEYRAASEALHSDDFPPIKPSYQNILNAYVLYDEICNELKKDPEIQTMLKGVITEDCYPDPELKTLTNDFCFYISSDYKKESDAEMSYPTDYSPQISVKQWVKLLNDPEIFSPSSLEILKRLKDYGGAATCKQLSVKYGETPDFYNSGISHLAKRIEEKTNCLVVSEKFEDIKRRPILLAVEHVRNDTDGPYIWKLLNELSAALDQIDLSHISLYASDKPGADKDSKNYWWLNANPKIWRFSTTSVGMEQAYSFYNENGNKRRVFQNFVNAQPGDMIIGYESTPVKQVIAIARVTRKDEGERLYFKKLEALANPIDYLTLKECPELEKMEYFKSQQGSLFKLTKNEYDFIMDMIRESNPMPVQQEKLKIYDKERFLEEVYMTGAQYDTLVSLLKHKKNLILQGAPGVGKTFAAKRLAYSMMGVEDDSRIEVVQFHQNYSYEDFVMGYKPDGNGFKLTPGIFHQFCTTVMNHPDKEFFFIIDEINRGNMSKIFGELLMLIEKGYRETEVKLSCGGMPFRVPSKLYIIGMMNTADRSLAMIDYALRRRFSFFKMEPGFHSKGFTNYQQKLNNETFDALISCVIDLNRAIKADDALSEGFCIGHSYFCGQETCTEEWMKEVVYYDILPMLEEYWFDDKEKVQEWESRLSGVFHDS